MTNFAPKGDREQSPDLILASWWDRHSIRWKTMVLAIAIGTIPTLAIGSVAYYFAAKSVNQEISNLKKTFVGDLQNLVHIFMSDRLGDIQVMANLDIFTNPRLSRQATKEEQTAALEKIQTAYGFYDSIAIFDLQGNVIAQTKGKTLGNHLNRSYVQDALKAKRAVISQPQLSVSSGVFSIYGTSPIQDQLTGKIIGFVRARIPVAVLSKLLQNYSTQGSQYYLLNNQGEIFLSSTGEYLTPSTSNASSAAHQPDNYQAITPQNIFEDTEELNKLLTSDGLANSTLINRKTNSPQLLTYAPAQIVAGLPDLKWQVILATDTALIYAPQRKLGLVFALGSVIGAVGIGAISYVLANRLLRPILQAANAVQEISRGNFTTRLEFSGTDEIAQFAQDINQMAIQLADFVEVQSILIQQSESIKDITLRSACAQNSLEILEAVVQGSYATFKAARVIYYQFDSQSAIAVAECAAQGYPAVKNSHLSAELFAEYQVQPSLPQIEVINDLTQTNLNPTKREYLASLGAKSSLIAPVVIENQLHGLLMVHQPASLLPWMNEEVKFLTQVANQIAFSVTRLELVEQQKLGEIREKSAREAMQARALSLLQEVDKLSQGDLTLRARVTDDEIGTIADAYNSTIASLQNLVQQTKEAATEVQLNTSANDAAVQSFAQDTIAQANSITRMLGEVQDLEASIALIAHQARQAEEFVHQATITIAREDQTMNRTVAEIKVVQHTITQTATKAEKLGESSQSISQAVNLIGRFAAQTHLLALKASIEAARAGEQGKGFAVIAEEVRSLATQSAEATAEIETLVSKIQLETNDVVQAMHQGAAQIASGNELVQQTRQSLSQVHHTSGEIRKLVSSITQATQHQSTTSAQVSQTIVEVTAIAEQNSQSATQVSHSIQELSAIADKLQSNIAKFKT
jgi:methyl-accepting chemotaxis protein PixJ